MVSSDIMSNPTYQKVLEGAKLARENNVDMILAVGGGSVMDCAKAVSWRPGMRGTFGRITGSSRNHPV